jgi:hypothetical protein
MSPPPTDDVHQAELTFARRDQLEQALQDPEIDVGCRPKIRLEEDGALTLTAFVTEAKMKALEARFDIRTRNIRNLSEQMRREPLQVGSADRFEGGRVAPRGLGRKI